MSDEQQALALRLWRESKRTVNPRHTRGAWTLVTRHNLIAVDGDILHLTDRGRQFIAEPAGRVAVEIDGLEGTLTVLRLVVEKGPGWRGDGDVQRGSSAAGDAGVVQNELALGPVRRDDMHYLS